MYVNLFSRSAKSGYWVLDHTADLRIRVEGTDMISLFIHAVAALYDLQFKEKPGPADQTGSLEILGLDLEDLLIRMLNECIYRFQANAEVFCEMAIENLEKGRLLAAFKSRRVDLSELDPEAEIKAATYHSLKIERIRGGYGVNIVFDM